MPDPNETPAPDPDEPVDVQRLIREGTELARQIEGRQYSRPEYSARRHSPPEVPQPPAERRPIEPEPGPGHYEEAIRYAYEAAEALRSDEVARAQALAAIGQIHATLAAGSAPSAGSAAALYERS